MKCTLTQQAWQWKKDGEHAVGKIVTTNEGDLITYEDGAMLDVHPDAEVLVAHSHTRELEFVRFGDLKRYPSEPIPEPAVRTY